MKTCFIHSRVILGRTLSECAVVVEGEKILYVGEHPGDLSGMRVIDGKGLYLSPGFVDIHVHGGGGFGVMDCSPDGILRMCETHLAHGTTSILPTTLAAPLSLLQKAILAVKAASERQIFTPFSAFIWKAHSFPRRRKEHKARTAYTPLGRTLCARCSIHGTASA